MTWIQEVKILSYFEIFIIVTTLEISILQM